MAKAVIGAVLIAADVAAIAFLGPAGIAAIAATQTLETSLFIATLVGTLEMGTSLVVSSIADALTSTPTTPQTVRSPASPWQAIYGNVRAGGVQIDINSYGSNFKYADMIICLAAHPTNGVQKHTETIPGDATFPAYGGLYINGCGVQWRNNAQGGSGRPGSDTYDVGGTPFGYATSNDIQDLNQNHYSFGKNVYMESYHGTGTSYQSGALTNNQVSSFFVSQGPSDHWNSSCTLMYDLGDSTLMNGSGYANQQGVPKGYSYVYLRLMYDSTLWASGLPQSLRFDMQGKNDIFDPRYIAGPWSGAYSSSVAYAADTGVSYGGFSWIALQSTHGITPTVDAYPYWAMLASPVVSGSNWTAAGAYIYTNNSALCIADFLCNPYWGMGYTYADINIPALYAAANICDTQVSLASGGVIAQYQVNGCFPISQTPSTTLGQMLATCDGDLSYVGGQFYIFPGAYVYPSATITPRMFAEGSSLKVQIGQKPVDLINAVKGTFISPAAIDTLGSPNIFLNEQPNIFNGQWQPQSYPPYAMDQQHGYGSDQWLQADGQKLYKEMSFPFVTSPALCQRLAKQALLKNRIGNGLSDSLDQGLSFSVDCNLSAYNIVPHDTVWVNYPRFNWTAPPAGFSSTTADIPDYIYTEFEVVDTSLEFRSDASGKPPVPVYTLNLRATSPDIYEWNGPDELPMTENQYPQFANMNLIAPVTNFTVASNDETSVVNPDGTQLNGMQANWTAPADGFVAKGGEIVLQVMPVPSGTQTYTSTNISGGGGVDSIITLSGTSNPYLAGETILLGGAGVGGAQWTGTIYAVSGQTLDLVYAPPTVVTNGSIYAASWVTVAKVSGADAGALVVGLVDGNSYYAQAYCTNATGATSKPVVAGPVTINNGTPTPGFVPIGILPVPIQNASGASILANPNFAAGNTGWALESNWHIIAYGTGTPAPPPGLGSGYLGYFNGPNPSGSAITNTSNVTCSKGSVISVNCLYYFDAGNVATSQLRINWYSATGALISESVETVPTVSAGVWSPARVVGVAPANTAYATVDFAVFANTGSIPWFVTGFHGAIQPSSLDEVPDGTTYVRLGHVDIVTNKLTASTAFILQGSVVPVNPFVVTFTTTSSSSGAVAITATWGADVLDFPDGSTLTAVAGTVTFSSLSPSTTYYLFPRLNTQTGVITIYSPLPTAASGAASNFQQADGYVATQAIPVVTAAIPSSGTTSGGGSGGGAPAPCPDENEIVREKTRGFIRVGDVQIGDEILGVKYSYDGKEIGRVYRAVLNMKTRYSETWYIVNGCKVSPLHDVRFVDSSRVWGTEWLTPHDVGTLDFSKGVRVHIGLDAEDYQQSNYLLHNRHGEASLVMHNFIFFPPTGC